MSILEYSHKLVANLSRTKNIHVRRHSSLQKFNCETSNIEIYSCTDCSFQTELTLVFKQHLQEHNKQGNKNNYTIKNYICEKCTFETNFSIRWLRHATTCLTNQQENNIWHECQQCPYKAKKKSTLKRHTIARHLDENDIKWYQCNQCPYKAKEN